MSISLADLKVFRIFRTGTHSQALVCFGAGSSPGKVCTRGGARMCSVTDNDALQTVPVVRAGPGRDLPERHFGLRHFGFTQPMNNWRFLYISWCGNTHRPSPIEHVRCHRYDCQAV